MTDLRAGTVIKALDFPPTVKATDSTSISNISTTTYTAGSPVVATAFMAPTSGKVKLIVSTIGRDNGAGNERLYVAPQVYLGTDATGTLILSPATRYTVSTMGEASNYHAQEKVGVLDGLDAGSSYYVRVMYRVTAGTTVDCIYRGVIVVPLT